MSIEPTEKMTDDERAALRERLYEPENRRRTRP